MMKRYKKEELKNFGKDLNKVVDGNVQEKVYKNLKNKNIKV
jgi:hypothetical protein